VILCYFIVVLRLFMVILCYFIVTVRDSFVTLFPITDEPQKTKVAKVQLFLAFQAIMLRSLQKCIFFPPFEHKQTTHD
jgi:hypothetical protein